MNNLKKEAQIIEERIKDLSTDDSNNIDKLQVEPHQQRVIDEKAEVDKKLEKLRAFIHGEVFENLTAKERFLLLKQFDCMSEYSRVLKSRISLFYKEDNEKVENLKSTPACRCGEKTDGCGGKVTYANQACMPLNGKVRTIDWCIHQIVAALNAGGVNTVACCCGHGDIGGSILLEDGRELLIREYQSVIEKDALPAKASPTTAIDNRGKTQ